MWYWHLLTLKENHFIITDFTHQGHNLFPPVPSDLVLWTLKVLRSLFEPFSPLNKQLLTALHDTWCYLSSFLRRCANAGSVPSENVRQSTYKKKEESPLTGIKILNISCEKVCSWSEGKLDGNIDTTPR